ncbi:MAG: hypothetical protein SFU98_06840 [Leptospiraceae bacterium]|nr:hypothetical protein [Leptospiraceae bacterium]
MKKILLLLSFAYLSHCASPPPVKTSNDVGALAISVGLYAPVALMGAKAPEVVYFLKVNPGKPFTDSKEVIVSNYSNGDRFYAFNAKPGTYVAIAAFYKVSAAPGGGSSSSSNVGGGTLSVSVQPGPTDYITFFSEQIAQTTLTEMKAGQVAYMGNLTADMSLSLEKADKLQTHSSNLIKPGALSSSLGKSMLSGSYNYLGILKKNDNSEAAKKEFKETSSSKELEESEWKKGL